MAIDTPCHCTLLRRGARALTQLYDQALVPSGLQVTQFSLLRTICRLPDEPTIGAIATATGLDRSTLGRNLRVVERAGFVVLESGDDARAVVVRVTADGREAIAKALPLWRGAQRRIEGLLGKQEREHIRRFVEALDGIGGINGATS